MILVHILRSTHDMGAKYIMHIQRKREFISDQNMYGPFVSTVSKLVRIFLTNWIILLLQ